MGHTHLNLEVELGYSHLLSTMEIASSTDNDVTEENINFHADTNVTSEGGENAGGQANISR